MKHLYTIVTLVILAAVSSAAGFPVKASADGSNCLPLNNGGTTSQQYCINPTPTPAPAPAGFPNQNQSQQTNSGLPVYPSSTTKTTPNTGPEDWVLPSLFLFGVAGLFLRKKAKIA